MQVSSSSSHYHNSGYVEYTDIFSKGKLMPSAGVHDFLLLFDSATNGNMFRQISEMRDIKLYQLIYLYMLDGSLEMNINGRDVDVQPNSLLAIMPESIIRVRDTAQSLKFYSLVVYPQLVSQACNDMGITFNNTEHSLNHYLCKLTRPQIEQTLNIYRELKHDSMNDPYKFQDVFLRSILVGLMVENKNIKRSQYGGKPTCGCSHSRQYNIYCKFLALLNKHSQEHRDVRYYADMLGISSKYLSYVCITYSKKNASTWIDESVIQKAKVLMIVHHYSINEISEAMHFDTSNGFRRFFKRVTGRTAKEFLASYKL